MGIALAPLAIAGSALSAGSSIMGGFAAAGSADYQAQIARNNAIIARQNAGWTSQAGNIQATNVGMRTRMIMGQQKARQGAAGVDVNTGSAADVRAGTDMAGMEDAITVRSNAAKKAYGELVQANNFDNQASADQSAASSDILGGFLSAGGSLLSNAAGIGSKYGLFQMAAGTGGGSSGVAQAPTDIPYYAPQI